MRRYSVWVLLGLALFTAYLNDVQVNAQSVPTEYECRPYIEKAIHELKTQETSVEVIDEHVSLEDDITLIEETPVENISPEVSEDTGASEEIVETVEAPESVDIPALEVIKEEQVLVTDEITEEEPTADSAEEPVAESAEEPTAESAEEPVAESAEEPTIESAEEPVAESAEEPAAESAEEPVVESAEEPAVESAEEPATESAEEPASESAEEPATESAEEPATKSAEEPVIESAEEPATESAEEPVAESAEEPVAESAEVPATESIEEPATESAEEPATESAEEPVTESAEEPVTESAEEPVIETAEEPAAESAEEAIVIESAEEPAAESIEEPAAESAEEPAVISTEEEQVTEIAEEPAAESAEESATINVEEPAVESAEEPVAESAEEPAAESAEELVAESVEDAPLAESIEEPATESIEEVPAAESAEELATENVEEPDVSAEEPAADSAEEEPADVSAEEQQITESTEEPVTASVEETATESAEEPAVESTEEPAVESAEEPAVESVEDVPVVESGEEPVAESTEEPAAESTEEPAAESAEEPAAESVEEVPVAKSLEETPVFESAEEVIAAESAEEPVAESAEEPVAESTEEPVAESAEEPVAESVEEAVIEKTEESATDSAEEVPVAESIEEPVAEEVVSATANENSPVEEDLLLEFEIPKNLRDKSHIYELLGIQNEPTEKEIALNKIADVILKDLKKIYDQAIKPLESLYKYRDLSNRHFGDPEIFSKPLILFMGPWSGGKSTILNYLTHNEHTKTSVRTGAEPSPAYFNIMMHGDAPEVLDGTQLAADWTFSGLQKFGQGLLDRLKGHRLPNKLLEKVNIVEIPGILEVRKQVSKYFPFNDACQWFIDRADIIFLVYDPSKLDVGPETEAILDQLKGREYQTRILLNKADQVKAEELLRVQSALIWNISPLMSSASPPVMYTVSLWSHPFEDGAPVRLLQSQERQLLQDMGNSIDKRIEHKIASARRFAVRVRNHAKMVDCYLTTYYNQKSLFGNKKATADKIIENPQQYHIYEGLSTLTNISRYDLPDPEVYRDFFQLNPLYNFQRLSETCTYFRGCPINKLDVAIAYDLPELVGKYKKMADDALEKINSSKAEKAS